MEAFVFCPTDTPEVNIREIALHGARVWRVDGTLTDCGRLVTAGVGPMGWLDMGTLREPYRVEGKKTMGFELAEQLDWRLPDVVLYPTGGGSGLIAMWKAFQELRSLGWVGGGLPRLIAVQASGCAPIVRAWEAGAERAEPWPGAETIAAGIRVPQPLGDFLILKAIRESAGAAIAVDDEAILEARAALGRSEGLLMSPEGAATYAGYQEAVRRGVVDEDERALLFNCASGLKYPMPGTDRSIAAGVAVDWKHIEAAK
jgi:threonine synthase